MRSFFASCALVALSAGAPPAWAQISVLTQDYDIGRSGANLGETILAPSNVSSTTFGRLFAYPVDEEVHAQPLYVPGLTVGGARHNVVFAATMGNTVYAFDADNPATATSPLWSVNLGAPVPSAKWEFTGGSGASHDGIYSTPVIDPVAGIMYVVAHVWSTAGQSVTLQLHALDIGTGSEMLGGPVNISASGFNADVDMQRAGLLLVNGYLYVAFASHSDIRENVATQKKEPYYGLVLSYDAQTLEPVGAFNAENGGLGAGIWQGGRGLASDGNYIYAATGNAITLGSTDYSESFVQLNPVTLSVASYYQDPDAACLNTLDLDLASSGPQVISSSGANVLVGAGKEAKVYALSLGPSLNVQPPSYFWGSSDYPTLPAEGGTCVDPRANGHGWIQGSETAYWNNPDGAYFYAFGNFDEIISWQVAGTKFTQASVNSPASLYPNTIALSANGATAGVLWTVASQATGPAIVAAYNAVPSDGALTQLWESSTFSGRDILGTLGRYSVPTVANGKVYIGTGSNQIVVYGLLPTTPEITVTPGAPKLFFDNFDTAQEAVHVNALAGFSGSVSLTLTGLPGGMTYSFNPASVNLSATVKAASSVLSINPAGAPLPLADNYTVVIQANGPGGALASAPMRMQTRRASFTAASSAGCNSSNQMSANLSWQSDGLGVPSIWIQDPTTPTFPGRLWIEPVAPSGSATTSYSITTTNKAFLYWMIDQSAGAAANFDNAFAIRNLGLLYSCP